jgi:hypothetical protein
MFPKTKERVTTMFANLRYFYSISIILTPQLPARLRKMGAFISPLHATSLGNYWLTRCALQKLLPAFQSGRRIVSADFHASRFTAPHRVIDH